MSALAIPELPLEHIYLPADRPEAPLLMILHGLGDRMQSFLDFPELLWGARMHHLLLNAPETYYDGGKWYDFDGLPRPGLENSRRLLGECLTILETRLQIPAARIVSSGFSQGAVVSLYFALRDSVPIAGVGALSGYFFGEIAELHPNARGLPVFMAHGRYDAILPFDRSLRHAEQLRAAGVDVTWREYPMEHSVCAEELQAFRGWLADRFPELKTGA